MNYLKDLEKDIKSIYPYTKRFKFVAEQFGHSITDVIVEGLRDIGIGEKDIEKRKAKYKGGDDLAYKLGHVIGAGVILLTPFWAIIVPFIFVAAVIYNRRKTL